MRLQQPIRRRRRIRYRQPARSIALRLVNLFLLAVLPPFSQAFQTPNLSNRPRTWVTTLREAPNAVVQEGIPSTTNGESASTSSSTDQNDASIDELPEPEDLNAFALVAARSALCLLQSDLRRNIKKASSLTNWIDDATAFALETALDQVVLPLPQQMSPQNQEDAWAWTRWMKTVPSPVMVDFSKPFRQLVQETLSTSATTELMMNSLQQQQQQNGNATDTNKSTRAMWERDFLARVSCRMILLPSGTTLDCPLSEDPASMIFGKLLYGGVTRSRLLPSSTGIPRQVSVRQAIVQTSTNNNNNQKKTMQSKIPPVWIMYGGPDRMYQSVDMGPAALLEVILLPRAPTPHQKNSPTISNPLNSIMTVNNFGWDPQQMFDYQPDPDDGDNKEKDAEYTNGSDKQTAMAPTSLSGQAKNQAFRSSFQTSVGGLQPQIDAIVRRVLDGRILRPADPEEMERQKQTSRNDDDDDTENDIISQELAANALEAEELAMIGLTPVRGLLLYGPPGCGKTALAREISRALRARAPKIVSAPELLDRWVGGSEKLVRSLFADAEAELAACQGDASRSALHVIVIDEIDAVFRHRSSADDSGESTRSSVVNQILAKLDGVQAIPNVLLIGMTNRRELLDAALLRPGRLEVQIEIPLPNREGRREILQIHFGALRERGRLSPQLCRAMDGVSLLDTDKENATESINNRETRPVQGRKRRVLQRSWQNLAQSLRDGRRRRGDYDLAADYATGGFSGADIAGLVRCAGSLALARSRQDGSGLEGLLITLEDVKQALEEVKRMEQ
mmetsp:Transcript_1627/g.3482  ORF Transcript_1627/g.3482 Transcript_1627/m.3482 type:complete len:791 (-) Transcript_1627:905-3277(-)